LRPIAIDCSSSLLLTCRLSEKSMAALDIEVCESLPACAMPTWLPDDFASSPAARGLVLLQALAAPRGQTIHFDYLDQTLAVKVSAC